MKTKLALILSASLAGSVLAQTPPAPAPAPAPAAPKTDDERPAGLAAALAADAALKAAEAARPPTPAVPKEPVKRITSDTEKGMRLNFRGVPLEQVLNYFGEVTGYIIVPKVSDIRGRVDVWSEDPLTKDEAVSVLNNALSRNGYAAFLSGRSLNIVNKDEMSRQPLPVNPTKSEPDQIPATENMVTQIIPIKFISAEQVIKNFESLLPTSSIMTANAGANALVITDTQINIKRVAEIIKALDTPVASVSAIRVFTLKFADAKALATVVKDLFAATDTRGGGTQQGGVNPMQQIFSRFGSGGGGAPGGGRGGSGGGAGGSGGRVSTPKVVASADELSNSLIVSAPEDSMSMIEDVVKQVDVPVEDVTEIKVFRLKYASADDTAAMLKNLFPDASTQGGNRGATGGGFRGGFFGGGAPGGGGGQTPGGGAGGAAGQSQRALKQNKVVAVADNRTTSVIVTASPTLMEQITGMIAQLDSDPSKQQKVFVIPVENADPAQMQQILQALFPTQSGRTAQSSGTRTGTGGFGTGTTTRNNGGQSGTSGRTGGSNGGFGGGGSSSGFGSSGGSSGGGFGGGR